MIERVVSGGQTGADRGGLDAAIHCGVPHGGWCPKGRLAEDGAVPAKYDLKETTSRDYAKRTEANVVDSDATVVFSRGKPTGGTKLTIALCERHGRPHLLVDLGVLRESQAISLISSWLRGIPADGGGNVPAVRVLNIAGSRESKAPGIAASVKRILTNVLNQVNGCGNIIYPQDQQTRFSARRAADRGRSYGGDAR